jgi:eukaryotic-like serine/threonine-protein kinase
MAVTILGRTAAQNRAGERREEKVEQRREKPPRPSARVSTLQAADLSTVCDRRHIEPGRLSQQLRGELDWIVMKAFEKDRNRRYATANDLAADVERYLRDEPVQACPPSAAYRFTKFARRNHVALVTSGLVALALIAGTGVSIWLAIRATNAEVAAITERDEKEQQAIRAMRAEQAALADRDAKARAEQQTAQALLTAQERLQFGRQAVDDMYTQFAEKWLAQQAELTQVQKQFLEKALAFNQRLATEVSTDPEVLFETAVAEQRVGNIQKKLEQHAEAEAAYRRAIQILEPLSHQAQAPAKYKIGFGEARSCLGWLLLFTGRPQEAEQEQRRAFTLFQALATQFPDDAQYQWNLAMIHGRLGQVLHGIGKFGEAQERLRQGIGLFQSLLARSPDDRDLKFQLAQSQANLAPVIGDTSPQEQENIYRSVARSAAELVAADPANPEYRDFQAEILQSWGGVLPLPERAHEAEAILRQALAIREGLVRDFPQAPAYRCSLAHALGNLGCVLCSPTQSEESEQLQRRFLETMERLASEYPKVPDYRSSVGAGLNNIALLLMDRGNWADARQLLEQAIVHQTAALEINSGADEYSKFLSAHLENLTQVQLALGDPTAAARTAEAWAHHINRKAECRALRTALHGELLIANAEQAQRPDNDPQRREYVVAENYLLFRALIKDAAQQSLDDPDQCRIADLITTAPEPLRDPDLALRLARRAVELKPGDGMCQQSLGWALWRSGDYHGSIEAIGKAANGGESNFVLAMAQWQLGEKTEAQTHFDSGSEWLKGYEQRCEEAAKQGTVKYPRPAQLKRLHGEAAAMLGVTLPTAEPAKEGEKLQ